MIGTSNRQKRVKGRDRYVLLDGMRGVAAVAILLYHLAWQANLETVLFGHAYLAVDFFFMLSGFVVADAYHRKLADGTMTAGGFVKARVIRLYPMILLGSLLALASRFVAIRLGMTDEAASTTLARFVSMVVLEPLHVEPGSSGLEFGFPLNEPLWSLFWELVANLAFVIAVRRLRTGPTVAFVGAFALGLAAFGLTHNGLDRGHQGWLGGFLRIGFAFPAGLALWFLRDRAPRLSVPLTAQLALLVLVLALPRPAHVNAVYDLAAAVIAFPVLIIAASRVALAGAAKRAAESLGAISYPLYALHDPVMQFLKPAFAQLGLGRLVDLVVVLVLAALITAASYAVLRFVDEPARAWLRRVSGSVVTARRQTTP